MSLNSIISGFKSGSAFANPMASANATLQSTLSSLSSAPTEVQTVITNIQSSITALQAQVTSMVHSLPTLLPTMHAADSVEKSMKIAQGILPAAGGGDGFNATFAPITASSQHLADLQSVITANLSGLNSGDPAALSALTTAHNTMTSNVSSMMNASAAAKADAIDTMKALSFAKFTTSPLPAHVQDLLSKTITTPPSITPVLMGSTPIGSSYLPSGNTPTRMSEESLYGIPSPVPPSVDKSPSTTLCGIGFAAFRDSYFAHMESVLQTNVTATTTWKALDASKEAWMSTVWISPTYAQLKDAVLFDPSDTAAKEAYGAARIYLFSHYPDILNWQSALDAVNNSRNDYDRLKNQWISWNNQAAVNIHHGMTVDAAWQTIVQCDSNLW